MEYNKYLEELYSVCFSDLNFGIYNRADVLKCIDKFNDMLTNEQKKFSIEDFLAYNIQKSGDNCVFYRENAYALIRKCKGHYLCLTLDNISLEHVKQEIRDRYPQIQYQLQLVNWEFICSQTKRNAFEKLLNDYDRLNFDPEEYQTISRAMFEN